MNRTNLCDLRITDDCMDGVGETAHSPSTKCYSPRRLLAWLLGPLRRLNKDSHSHVSHSQTQHSEGQLHVRNDTASFKLGVGCGFLYLIATTKNELDKMVQLQREMETLLQNAKQTDALACSITDIQQVSTSDDTHLSVHSQTPCVRPESRSMMVPNRFLEYNNEIKQDECVEEINELQAEFEFEFELERLHLHLNLAGDAQQERLKGNVEDSCSESHSSSFGEIVMDPQGASADVSFAVSPVELERRLHELLQARLQERITELESALKCTKQKLMEKEMEVTWWKDTAQLISQHVPETARFTFRLDPETALKLCHL